MTITAPLAAEKIDEAMFVSAALPTEYAPPRAGISPVRGASWLRRALPLVRAHWWVLAVALLASAVSQVILVEIPDVVRRAVDTAIASGDGDVGRYVLVICLLAVAQWAAVHVFRVYLFKLANRLEFDLRCIVYEHVTRMSTAFFDRNHSGAILSRASADIRAVQRVRLLWGCVMSGYSGQAVGVVKGLRPRSGMLAAS